jgi:hypothetical protein
MPESQEVFDEPDEEEEKNLSDSQPDPEALRLEAKK